jgi:hypothetical protein
MIKFKSIIKEFAHSTSYIQSLANRISKNIGQPLYGNPDAKFHIIKSDGEYEAVLYSINSSGNYLRFCSFNDELQFIDFIYNFTDFPTHTINIKLNNLNEEQIIEVVSNFLKTGNMEQYVEDYINESMQLLKEYRTKGALGKSPKKGDALVQKHNIEKNGRGRPKKVEIQNAKSEIKPAKKIDIDIYNEMLKENPLTPDEQLDKALPLLVNKVVKSNRTNSFILMGSAGSGKTFGVLAELRKLGYNQITIGDEIDSLEVASNPNEALPLNTSNFVYYRGRITTTGVYNLMFKYKNYIIVIDDCDDLFLVSDGTNLLKAVTESEPVRTLSNLNARTGAKDAKIPASFKFTGKVFFITNLELSKIEPALISRAEFLEVKFSNKEMLDRIHSKMDKVLNDMPSATMTSKMQVFHLCTKISKQYNLYIDFRTFESSVETFLTGDPMWQPIVIRTIIQKNQDRIRAMK